MSKEDGRFSTVIRSELREQFFKEVNKGTIINDLLEKHYGGAPPAVKTHEPQPKQESEKWDIRPMSELVKEPETILDPGYEEDEPDVRLYRPPAHYRPDPDNPTPFAVYKDPARGYSYQDDAGEIHSVDYETYMNLPDGLPKK